MEFAALPDGHVAVRDSKQQAGPALVFTRPAWQAFCAAIKTGNFNHV